MKFDLQKNINLLKSTFANQKSFSTKDVFRFFHEYNKEISNTAIHWKIHTLKKQGIFTSLGKGLYALSNLSMTKKTFQPKVSPAQKLLFAKIKKQYPLAKMCFWSVRWVHEFMTHLPAVDWTIIEAEKDITESLYYFLREHRHDVYLNPSAKELEKSVAYDRKAVIIKNLVSQSPLLQQNAIPVPSVEKILVDLFVDSEIFDIYQGAELAHIFKGAFEKYQINVQRLKRYAARRKQWDSIQGFIAQQVRGDLK